MLTRFLIVFGSLVAIEIHAQQQVPVFSSKVDSAAYFKLEAKLNKRFEEILLTKDYEKLDSLGKARIMFLEGKNFFYRSIYGQDRSFTPYQLLPKIANKDSITKISVIGKGKRRLPDSLYMYKNLAELELIDFKLTRLPRKLFKRRAIRKVIISTNLPSKNLRLPKNKSVTSLIIRGDEQGKLPVNYRKFRNLFLLQLSRNNLKVFPKIEAGKKLARIDLSANSITTIPSWVGDITSLISLNLNNNKVATIEPGLEKIEGLQELSLYKNNLPELPSMLYKMTSLRVVDLYYNHIPRVAGEIGNLKNLEILYLANNEIYTVPEEIGKLTNLKELYLHHNKISNLPTSIGNLTSLSTLRINNNSILEWPSGLSNLKSLSNFDCSFNQFETLPIPELDFRNMKILSIGGNPWDPKLKPSILSWVDTLRQNQTVVHVDDKMLE